MVIGVFLILLGAMGPIAVLQWRSGHWLDAARWIARNSSVHVLYATPIAGVLLACLGFSIIWSPAVVLVFLAAFAFMTALLASPHRRRAQAAHQPVPAAHGARRETGVSGPLSSRADIARRTERPRAGRRPPPRRSPPGPTTATRDARRAG
ncbi:MAG TPA: hypothetical protein VGL18_06620 [Actinomycetota bacterium]